MDIKELIALAEAKFEEIKVALQSGDKDAALTAAQEVCNLIAGS